MFRRAVEKIDGVSEFKKVSRPNPNGWKKQKVPIVVIPIADRLKFDTKYSGTRPGNQKKRKHMGAERKTKNNDEVFFRRLHLFHDAFAAASIAHHSIE